MKCIENFEVLIVEINPLAEFAGTGMFTWEHDKNVLLGESPFEFRLQLEYPKFLLKNICHDAIKYYIIRIMFVSYGNQGKSLIAETIANYISSQNN